MYACYLSTLPLFGLPLGYSAANSQKGVEMSIGGGISCASCDKQMFKGNRAAADGPWQLLLVPDEVANPRTYTYPYPDLQFRPYFNGNHLSILDPSHLFR